MVDTYERIGAKVFALTKEVEEAIGANEEVLTPRDLDAKGWLKVLQLISMAFKTTDDQIEKVFGTVSVDIGEVVDKNGALVLSVDTAFDKDLLQNVEKDIKNSAKVREVGYTLFGVFFEDIIFS